MLSPRFCVMFRVCSQMASGAKRDEILPPAVLRSVIDVMDRQCPPVSVEDLPGLPALHPAALALPPGLLFHLERDPLQCGMHSSRHLSAALGDWFFLAPGSSLFPVLYSRSGIFSASLSFTSNSFLGFGAIVLLFTPLDL